MAIRNTIVGVRKTSSTVIASNGVRVTEDGVILKHKANRVLRLGPSQVLFSSTLPEAMDEEILAWFKEALTKTEDDPRRAAQSLAGRIAEHRFPASQIGEIVIGATNYLGCIDLRGGVTEPDEGFVAVGSAALIAMGALKALLKFSSMEPPQIAREALLISAEISVLGNNQIFCDETPSPG